jgi:hypothetical protein
MNPTPSTMTRLAYGRKLVNAGISGVRTGHQSFNPQLASTLINNSAGESLRLAAIGACLGMLPAIMMRGRSRHKRAVACMALGSALGFCASFSWKTRKLTSSLAHSAMNEVHRVQDEHWLETNPIDYA